MRGFPKLSESQVLAIRARLERGARPKDLGAEFGVHPGHISRIGRLQRWPAIAPGTQGTANIRLNESETEATRTTVDR
jgi:hypothetical protein